MTMEAFEREVEDRFRVVKGLYGDRLDEEQLAEVRKGVETIVRAAEALKTVRLRDGDEPSWVFTPHRDDDRDKG